MTESLFKSGRSHLPTSTREDSLWARLRSLESDQTNAESSPEKLHIARTSVTAAVEHWKAVEQEITHRRDELSDAILEYKGCQVGHKGEWTHLRDEIGLELGLSTRGIYRIITLSGSTASANVKVRTPRVTHTDRLINSCENLKSTTDRLGAELAQRVSQRLRRKIRAESDVDFNARVVAEVATRMGHSKTQSTGAAVQLVLHIMQTTGLIMLDLQSIRVAPD